MSDSNSPRAPPALDLPPAALHAHARYEPHPDSAEAVRIERQRCAKELEPVCRERASCTPSGACGSSRPGISRSYKVPARGDSSDTLRRHGSVAGSRASTQADVPTFTEEEDEEESERKRQWYDNIVKFWTTQISLTIDEGGHRDHLGMSHSEMLIWDYCCCILTVLPSTRTHLSRLPPHLASPCNDRHHNCPTVSIAAYADA